MEEGVNVEIGDTVPEWIQLFAQMPGNLSPGGVFLVFGGNRPLNNAAAALEIALYSLFKADERRAFRGISHLVPSFVPRTADQVLDALRVGLANWNWPSEKVEEFIGRERFAMQATGDADDLICLLNTFRTDTAIIVGSAQIYRFGAIRSQGLVETTAWTGLKTRLNVKGQLEVPHMFELARQSMAIAAARSLLVVLLCETSAPQKSELPADLNSSDGIAILNSHFDPAEDAVQQFVDLVKRVCDGTAFEQDWETEISVIVNEPHRRALMLAQLFLIRQKPFHAWAILEPYSSVLNGEDPSTQIFAANVALSAGKENYLRDLL
jgi:hypothetical protein